MTHQVSLQGEQTRNCGDANSSREDNVLGFTRSPPSNHGATALNLVYQAAEVFRDMEEHAREIETRAQSLCKSAVDRLKLAEMRTEEAERSRREVINDAERKLQDASRALGQAEKRIVASEDQVTALEFRAKQRKHNFVTLNRRFSS